MSAAEEEKGRQNARSLKLLTLNTWGLKYLSKFRKERLQAIADRLSSPASAGDEYDIVALQEIWCDEDWQYIKKKCKGAFPYSRKFMSGIISGPGLVVLSKVPIESTFLYRFPINGRASAFFRGDWYVGKSIAVTLLRPHYPEAIPIALLNSHMHAPYGCGDSSYSCHRACQAWDFTKIVSALQKAGYAIIQVGDLNSRPGSLPYKLFTITAGLVDSWNMCQTDAEKRKSFREELATMDPKDQVLIGGVTCDSQLNTWRANRKRADACRLDYAFIDPSTVHPFDAKVVFTERLPPPFNCSYSDHFGYSVEFNVAYESGYTNDQSISTVDKLSVLKEILAEIETYRSHTIPYQANWRKFHFLLSIVLVIAIHVGITFAANRRGYAAVLLLFASTVTGITGVVNGLIWFLGVRSESRALAEVQLEVEDSFMATKNE
ncbi:Piso0_001708 [Millerozyma farinosa CBS 7064]|uniref:Piso0_001708 protein n=1 Tax=Pichia sorbitophila (strain ATCC MYA-4447 / BCRC 22081 / CBS 7064 / NBRC 10061 / NRRL Y-12695) TaxID=559304 RepID=G8YNW2_PICSO|nr:Piso0_001708 [Millerozyma farinosa CBS 7064]